MTIPITVRDIRSGEHERLGQALGDAYRDSFTAAGLPAVEAEAMSTMTVRSAFVPPPDGAPSYWTIRVAVDADDRPLGVLLGGLAPKTGLATIFHVWVDRAVTDGDVMARALLEDLETLARDAGIARIQFCVAVSDHLQQLCEQMSFAVKSIAMTRRLDQDG